MKNEVEAKLLKCKSINEFLAMFFGLSLKDRLSVFEEIVEIKQGAYFYRARSADGFKDSNYKDVKEWGLAPKRLVKQGRFNRANNPVLYVASDSITLGREINLKNGEDYYIAQYKCKKDFKVGTFLGKNSLVNMLIHKIAMSIHSEKELTDEENVLIESYYKHLHIESIEGIATDMLASLYIHKLVRNLYDVTNKLGKILLMNNECGIRYSSVYAPIELSGANKIITFNDIEYGNYALTEKGYANIELINVEKQTYKDDLDMQAMIEVFSEAQKERK